MNIVKLAIGFVLVYFLFFFLTLQIPDDPDFGLNLRVGEYIQQTRHFPYTDFLSFSMPAYPYAYHSWFAQYAIKTLYDQGGLIGVSLFMTAIGAGSITLLYFSGKRNPIVLIIYLVVSSLVFSSIGARPQMFTFFFLCVQYFLLQRFTRLWLIHSSHWHRPLLLLIPIYFLWANIHPGFSIGLIFFLLYVGVAFIWGRTLFRLQHGFLICLIFFSVILATLCTPYTYHLYTHVFTLGQNPYNLSSNLEWMPLVARGPVHWVFAGIVLVSLLVIIKGKNVPWPLYVATVFFFWLTLRNTRTAMVFLVAFVPLMSFYIDETLRFGSFSFMWDRRSLFLRFVLVLFCFSVVLRMLGNGGLWWVLVHRQDLLAERQSYPWGAVQYMKQHEQPKRIFNYYNWGGYLVWHLPSMKVFEIGTMDVYKKEQLYFLETYFDTVNASPGWDKTLEAYQIDAVLLPPDAPLIQILQFQPEWSEVYRDRYSVLMKKRLTFATVDREEYLCINLSPFSFAGHGRILLWIAG